MQFGGLWRALLFQASNASHRHLLCAMARDYTEGGWQSFFRHCTKPMRRLRAVRRARVQFEILSLLHSSSGAFLTTSPGCPSVLFSSPAHVAKGPSQEFDCTATDG